MSFDIPADRMLNIKRRLARRLIKKDDEQDEDEQRQSSHERANASEGEGHNEGEEEPEVEEAKEEVDPEVAAWLNRPVNSSEKRKRFFLDAAKFDMQEFFDDRDDDAKQTANVQASFIYGEKRQNE